MTDAVIVSLRVRADQGRAFRAFTQDIGLWWRRNPLFAATPRADGVLKFEPGPDGRLLEVTPGGAAFEIGRVRIWAPPERLTFTWRAATFAPDMESEVEVTFEPFGDETRVTVAHRGWLAVPQAHAARHGFPDLVFQRRAAEWWQGEIAALAAMLRP